MRRAALAMAALLSACGGDVPHLGTTACTSGGGYVLSDRAVACQGVFTGPLESQCRQGWTPCTKAPLLPSDCANLPGYFAAARSASTACGDAVNVLLGCGTFGGPAAACSSGFSRRVPCGGPVSGSPYTCSSGWSVSNSDPKSGVLCCQVAP